MSSLKGLRFRQLGRSDYLKDTQTDNRKAFIMKKLYNPYEKVCLKYDYFVWAKEMYLDKHGLDSQSSHSLS